MPKWLHYTLLFLGGALACGIAVGSWKSTVETHTVDIAAVKVQVSAVNEKVSGIASDVSGIKAQVNILVGLMLPKGASQTAKNP